VPQAPPKWEFLDSASWFLCIASLILSWFVALWLDEKFGPRDHILLAIFLTVLGDSLYTEVWLPFAALFGAVLIFLAIIYPLIRKLDEIISSKLPFLFPKNYE
jgi:hypothetical protein